MNSSKHAKLPRLLDHLRHLIHADSGRLVRRRDLYDPNQGEVQLELELEPRAKGGFWRGGQARG
jgi:hypothetical protein